MAYRDDLEQARSCIARLEDELVEAHAQTAALAARTEASVPKPRTRRAAPIAAGVVVVRWVDDVVRVHPVGEHTRARGALVHGSEKRQMNGEQCSFDFVLEHGGAQLPVHHDGCVLPDFFGREPSWVTAEGELRADGTFLAADVLVAFRDEMH